MEVGAQNTSPLNLGFDPFLLLGGVFGFILAVAIIAGLLYLILPYFIAWYKYKDREKTSLEFVLLQVSVPRANETKIDAAEQLFATFYSIKTGGGMLSFLHPQPHLSFEIVALNESIKFYVSCQKKYQDLIEKQINGAYPDAEIKEVQEYNIFTETGQVAYSALTLRAADYFPIKTYKDLPTDPMSALTSALSKMQPGEGATVQMILSPADAKWKNSGKSFLKKEKDPG